MHRDDFVAVAEDGQLDHFEQVLENSMKIKRVGRIGPGRSSTGKVPKRIVHWSRDGFTWEADPRLTEKLISMLNLSGGKGALTPGGKDIGRDVRDSDCELGTLMPTCAGRCGTRAVHCLRSSRHCVKTALQQMSKPTKLMQLRVVRVGRSLKNNPRLVWKFPYPQPRIHSNRRASTTLQPERQC